MITNALRNSGKKISKQYRSQIHTIRDILEVIMDGGREGVIVSTISRRANLAHYPALKRCEKLVSAGLVKPVTIDQKNVFIITEKGIQIFQEFKIFQNLVESYNLKY